MYGNVSLGAGHPTVSTDTTAPRRRDLRRALEPDRADSELALVYQPVVSAASGEPVGLEALVRWTHPRLGLLRPAEFPPATGSTDLVRSLDRRVLQMAVRQAATWHHRRLSPRWVSVNVAGPSLDDSEFVDFAHRLLQHYPEVAGGNVVIEVDERDALRPDRMDVLRRFSSDVGIRVSIDGVRRAPREGSRLRDTPARFVKLDREFARSADERRDRLRDVVDQARTGDMYLIAQGVETASQERRLRRFDVDALQGFRFAHPSEPGAVEASLDGG